ncbi:hypothetical protein RN001_002181 [Aquatica leii]|uniref:MRG-binding protein n=1 Tax=Aquatica leii TaxID=1421715 RepID=A0AAN7PD23_9COLE|nr:hypothetical protein RN001_002181 [Aquatica leii]
MEDFEWNVQHECYLLEAMIGHKPIGINKSFQMFMIYDKFRDKVEKEVLSHTVWSHLESMYNLEALDEGETLPFPNIESDFDLPDGDFAELKESKIEEKKNVQKGRETPKGGKELKKDDKTPNKNAKEVQQRRDSKDSRSSSSSRKESKRENDKPNKSSKGRSTSLSKDESHKSGKTKNEEIVRSGKRPTRGSVKPDDGISSGKSSPLTISGTGNAKRRRI